MLFFFFFWCRDLGVFSPLMPTQSCHMGYNRFDGTCDYKCPIARLAEFRQYDQEGVKKQAN